MANKINEVQILREYCERRWDNQDKYYGDSISRLYRNIVWVTVFMLVSLVSLMIGVNSEIHKLQNRVDHIEQTWSE